MTYVASNIFPEIALYLLKNKLTGAGAIINESQIDIELPKAQLISAVRTNFTGTVSSTSRVNLREFIYEHGGYCITTL